MLLARLDFLLLGIQDADFMIETLANVPSKVLILGENGTGKELVAAALHGCGTGRERHVFPCKDSLKLYS